MKHWACWLFSNLRFDDFTDRAKIGNKKEVQTCLKQIRLYLSTAHEDFISSNDIEEEHNGNEVNRY